MKFLTESAVWDILENLVLDGCLSIHFELVNRGGMIARKPLVCFIWTKDRRCEM